MGQGKKSCPQLYLPSDMEQVSDDSEGVGVVLPSQDPKGTETEWQPTLIFVCVLYALIILTRHFTPF